MGKLLQTVAVAVVFSMAVHWVQTAREHPGKGLMAMKEGMTAVPVRAHSLAQVVVAQVPWDIQVLLQAAAQVVLEVRAHLWVLTLQVAVVVLLRVLLVRICLAVLAAWGAAERVQLLLQYCLVALMEIPTRGGGGGGGGIGGAGGSGVIIISYQTPVATSWDLFSGTVDEPRLYNRALSAAEVVTLSQPPMPELGSAIVDKPPTVGATSYSWQCAAGYYGTSTLVTTRNTNTNVWTTTGSVAGCTACSPGIYCPFGSTTNAVQCPEGFYCSGSGMAPTQCPSGTASPAGSLVLAACNTCPAGTFSAPGSPGCVPCPTGSWGSAAGADTCNFCPAGTYSIDAPGQVLASTCALCPGGYFSTTVGAFLQSVCTMCPDGVFCPPGSTTASTPCPAGSYCAGSGAPPMPCPAGTASSTTGAIACTQCMAGAYAPYQGMKACTPCAAGTYSTEMGATSNTCIASETFAQELAWLKVPPPSATLTGRGGAAGIANATSAIFLGGTTGRAGGAYPPRLVYSISASQLSETYDSGAGAGGYRLDRAATATAPDGNMWAFGGVGVGGVEVNTLAYFNPGNGLWTIVTPIGALPPARKQGAMTYLSDCTDGTTYPRACLLLFGGDVGASASTATRFGDVWAYFGGATNAWVQPTAAQSSLSGSMPPPTTAAAITASLDGKAAYIFGGNTAAGSTADMYVLDPRGLYFAAPLPLEMDNLALNKTAYSSSTSNNCLPKFATDGAIPVLFTALGFCQMMGTRAPAAFGALTATGGEQAPWLYVDLGATVSFDSIAVYTRAAYDMGPGRFAGLQLWFGNSNLPPTLTLPPGQGANTKCTSTPADLVYQSNVVSCKGTGRYVWLNLPASPTTSRYIFVSEFQVLARRQWVWRKLSGYANLAYLANAFASTVYRSSATLTGDPMYVTDGALANTGYNFAHTTAQLTAPLPDCNNIFVTVDLGRTLAVQALAFWPRIDCCRVRSKRLEFYVGNSRDWRGNKRVLAATDIEAPGAGQGTFYLSCPASFGPSAPGTACWTINLPAAASGRYVSVRKVPFNAADCSVADPATYTSIRGGAGTAQDNNVLNFYELGVYGQTLVNQPLPRSHMAYTSYRGAMVISGGVDKSGFYLPSVQTFDLATNTWSTPLEPLGTAPSSRTSASLLALPNPASTLYLNVPSNGLALANGFDSSGEPIGDMNVLHFKACSPSPFDAVPVGYFSGIATESCTNGGTVCSYTCTATFAPATANGPTNTIVCSPSGAWIGSLPVCIPTVPVSAPSPGTTSLVRSGFFSAQIGWQPPAPFFWPVVGYKVTALAVDWTEKFVNYDSSQKPVFGFPNPGVWRVTETDAPTTSFYYFDTASGALVMNNMEGAGTRPNLGMQVVRDFPTEAGLNIDGDWAVETYMSLDTSSANQVQQSQNIGLCPYNSAFPRSWAGGIGNGTCVFFAGIRMAASGALQYGWESFFASPGPAPSYTNTGWNNWFQAPGGSCWMRLERRGLQGATPALGGSWRVAFKFQAAGTWIYMPDVGRDSRVPGGRLTQPLASNLKIGFITRTFSATQPRLLGYFYYLRFAPLTDCNMPGSTRVIANASTTSTEITGLAPGQRYTFAVQTIVPAGLISARTVVSGSITTAPATTTEWATNLPALYAAGTLVDALTATPYVKTTYQVSVWANNAVSFGPNCAIDGLPGTGGTGFAQAGFGSGHWLPAGPRADKSLASTYTGTSYVLGNAAANERNPPVSPLGDWWAVDLGIATSVKALYILGRQDPCCVGRTAVMEIWIGNAAPPYWNLTQRCNPAAYPVANITRATASVTDPKTGLNRPYGAFFQCLLTGRYVYVRAPGIAGTVTNFGLNQLDGQFNFAELRIYASNKCPARTGVNVVTNTPTACGGANGTIGSVYGAVCVQTCASGFTPVSGSGVANCDGDKWDSPPLVCSQTCPVLSAPVLADKCTQTLFADSFVSPLSLNYWKSPNPVTQGIGMTWFAPDGTLEATNNLGCNDQMILTPLASKLETYVGDFTVSAIVSPQGPTQAGLVFFTNAQGSNFTRVVLDASGVGIHTLDRVVNGQVFRITDTMAVSVLPFQKYALSVAWKASTGQINVTVDGVLVMSTNDFTFTKGSPGVFAATNALFDRFTFGVPCSNGCSGALDGELCTFTCHAGLLPTGPPSRTCAASTGAWLPDVATNPLVCTVPAPVFYATRLSVSEAASKNAPVGQPLVASSSASDYQLQWAIDSETPSKPEMGSLFFIDFCSGQVKLRQGGAMDYVAWTSSYTLLVRVSIAGFAGAETVRNITVDVLQVDTPPVVAGSTTLYLPENSAFNASLPVIGYPYFWDRENSTILPWLVTADTSRGLFVMNNRTAALSLSESGGCTTKNTSNACESSVLNFEDTKEFTLQVSAAQASFCCGTAPFPPSTGSVTIVLIDVNDAPQVAPFQILSILNTDALAGAVVGNVTAVDEDGAASTFSLSVNFSLVSPFLQGGYPACTPGANVLGSYPTVDSTANGAPLFEVTSFVDNEEFKAGSLAFSSSVTMPLWTSRTPFTALGSLVRAVYTVCLNVSDNTGLWSIGPVTVVVKADTVNTPVILSWNASAAGMSTMGGEILEFNGTGFSPGIAVIMAVYSNDAGLSFNSSCARVSFTKITCMTAPGVGVGFVWTMYADNIPVPALSSLVNSYRAPVVLSVSANLVDISTDGATVDGKPLLFTGQRGTFPPTPAFVVTLQFGATLQYSCAVLLSAADSFTTIRCNPAAGFGANLPWTLTVGGQATTSSGYPATWPLISYGRPNVTSAAAVCSPIPCIPASFNLTGLDTAGNQLIQLTGRNFGVGAAPIIVTFGTAAGTAVTMTCARGANPHTNLICQSPPGLGTAHSIQVSLAGQIMSAPYGVFSYLPPVITRVSGAGAVGGSTEGGALLLVEGHQFGPVAGALGMTSSDSVTYGHLPSDVSRFAAQGCIITASPDAGTGPVWGMQCTTTEGAGSGLAMVLSLGGQASPVFEAGISYGYPQISSYSDKGAVNADTAGGESVKITGVNFGPGSSNPLYASYFAPRMQVEYGVQLQNGPFSNLTFYNAACTVVQAHKELVCTTQPGAGRGLSWQVTLDGLISTMPTTSYAAPEVSDITDENGAAVNEADVNGGSIVWIMGKFFGPQIQGKWLVQRVTYGPTGSEILLPASAYNVTSQTKIVARLPPGSGRNLRVSVSVADQLSAASSAAFSYAPPAIIALTPRSAKTASNRRSPTLVTITALNLPLLDPSSLIGVLFGNYPYVIGLSPVLPVGAASVRAARNADGSFNISVPLPDAGSGCGLAVRITITPIGSTSPAFTTPIVYMPGTPNEFVSEFNYNLPVISAVIVSRARFILPAVMGGPNSTEDIEAALATGAVLCPFPYDPITGAESGLSCRDNKWKLIEVLGNDFGLYPTVLPGSVPLDRTDGVSKALELYVDVFGTSSWTDKASFLYAWSHNRIAFYSVLSEGKLHVTQSNKKWSGDECSVEVVRDYINDSPAISNLVGGTITAVPTTGGDPSGTSGAVGVIEFSVANLVSVQTLELRVGIVRVPPTNIINPASGTGFATDAAVAAWINTGTFPGGLVPLKFIAPAGQGKGLFIHVINNQLGGGVSQAKTELTLSYAIPVITSVSTILVSTGAQYSSPVSVPVAYLNGAPVPEVTIPTDGTVALRIFGTNLGASPVIALGDSVRLSGSALRACTGVPASGFTSGHSCWEVTAPEGEGDGRSTTLYGYYTVEVDASAVVDGVAEEAVVSAQRLRFSYLPPSVTSVDPAVPGTGFPTAGGTALVVSGQNFGYTRIGRDPSVSLSFSVERLSGSFLCEDVTRLSHTRITCTLPEGSGRDITVTTTVAGLVGVDAKMFSYTPPAVTRATIVPFVSWDPAFAASASSLFGSVSGAPGNSMPLLNSSTLGGDVIVLQGSNFGKQDASAHCAFLTWTFRSSDPVGRTHGCDGLETFLGEGEVAADNVELWGHSLVAFRVPPGLGTKDIELSVRGTMLGFSVARSSSGTLRFRYFTPALSTLRIGETPSEGMPLPLSNTEGNDAATLLGSNFGPIPRNTLDETLALPGETGFALPLEDAPALPTAYLVLTFHRTCLTNAYTVTGRRSALSFKAAYSAAALTLDKCSLLAYQDNTTIKFPTTPGIGADRRAQVIVVEDASRYLDALNVLPLSGLGDAAAPAGVSQLSGNSLAFSYRPPSISSFDPSRLDLTPYDKEDGGVQEALLDIYGGNFGNDELAIEQGWTDAEKAIAGSVGGITCTTVKRRRQSGRTVLNCALPSNVMLAGYRNASVLVAGQRGSVSEFENLKKLADGSEISYRPVLVVCGAGFYGHINETCLKCPAQFPDNPALTGAYCKGFDPNILAFNSRFTYPRPLKGWYNLNSSDKYTIASGWTGGMMSNCPEGFQDAGRDVCLVPCDPPSACIGDNVCAYGFTSKAPQWRCSSCDKGFYKRAGDCVKCPDSPAAQFIGFAILVIFVAGGGFMLNKKQVNIAVLSIGIDFFQILAIFAQSGVKWPPIVKELLHILSAFNLNIEIVAPECLIPDVSYKAKFWFIMLLPLSVGGLLGVVFLWLAVNKGLIKGRPKKKWFTHTPTLVSSGLVLLYLLYLYLTRTIMDVFNCTPTMPPDGYLYLSVADNERCGIQGGTQQTLVGYAVAGLIVYTLGYPLFLAYTLWTNKELVMEDQLLRAKGVGMDRLSNPHAFNFRKTFGRSYFQFKPDFCLWILVIIIRKLCIAITAVVFGKNSAFQMAACLLIMFLAYSAQMMARPYMSPGEYEEVLKTHTESSFTYAIHARLRSVISQIETRGRKKARKNLLNADGKIDRTALLGVLSGWLFNYNTVEQLMVFSAVIVCLMGIMYQANELSSYYPESKDSVTAVVMFVIITSIIYFAIVVITEIVVLYNESAKEKQLKSAASRGKKGSLGAEASGKAAGKGRLVDDSGDINTGKVDTQMNPLFMNANGGASNNLGASGIKDIMSQRMPPSPDLWMLIQQSYVDLEKQLETANATLYESKRREQMGGVAKEVDAEVPTGPKAGSKKAFAPHSSEAGAGGADAFASGNPLTGGSKAGASFRAGASLRSLRTTK